jgi:hypothetical protein
MQSPIDILTTAMEREHASRILVGHKLEAKLSSITNTAESPNLTEPRLYKLCDVKPCESRWVFEEPTITTKVVKTPHITTRTAFAKAFAEKTHNALKGDFDNILVAGGSISSIMFDTNVSDFDIFVYGLGRDEATRRVYMLIQEFTKLGQDIKIINSPRCTTIKVGDMKFQVIHRLYNSIAEILYGFDISSCAVGFNGRDIYFTELAKFSFEYMCNVIDLTRRSTTYEQRLIKYLRRGFSIIMPDFNMSVLRKDNLKYGLHEVCELPHLAFSYKKLAWNEIQFAELISKYDDVSDYLDYVPRKVVTIDGDVDRKKLPDPMKSTFHIKPTARHSIVHTVVIDWLVIDPGTQVNGSMKPSVLSKEEWYGPYYLPTSVDNTPAKVMSNISDD